MHPVDIAQALRAEGREDMALATERMIIALRIAANNLIGQGLDQLRPVSAEFAAQIGELCACAADGDPHSKLDEALRNAIR